jgi:hypothetical protein
MVLVATPHTFTPGIELAADDQRNITSELVEPW